LDRMSLPTAADIERRSRPLEDPAVVARVQGVFGRLLQAINEPRYSWRVVVLNTPVPNAYALPNGYLYVHSGLLALGPAPTVHPYDPSLPVPPALSDDELAFVLGHEMAHVTQGHMLRLQDAGRSVNGITSVAGMAPSIVGVLARQTLQKVVTSGFSREYEAQADEWGLRYATLAGYEAGAALLAFERLHAYEMAHPVATGVFANHPRTADRLKHVRGLIASSSQLGQMGTLSGRPNPSLPWVAVVLPELRGARPEPPKLGFERDPRMGVGITSTSQVPPSGSGAAQAEGPLWAALRKHLSGLKDCCNLRFEPPAPQADVCLELRSLQLTSKRMPWPGGSALRLELDLRGSLWVPRAPQAAHELAVLKVREAVQESGASTSEVLVAQVVDEVAEAVEVQVRRLVAQWRSQHRPAPSVAPELSEPER
jgi:metalloendopeptidase OMA1, mitochondrial